MAKLTSARESAKKTDRFFEEKGFKGFKVSKVLKVLKALKALR